MLAAMASLAACGGGGGGSSPTPPPVAAKATLASPSDGRFEWRTAQAASITLTDTAGHVIAASATTCAAHDATQVTVSADCTQVTALRVGSLLIDVSGGGATASLAVTGVPQRHWSGVHGASRYAALAVGADGGASAWGDNDSGILDQDADNSALVSLGVATSALSLAGTPFSGVMQATMGQGSGAVLLADGSAQAWGDNGFRELGASTVNQPSLVPVAVNDLTEHASLQLAVQLEIGQENGVALMDDGSVVSWGNFPGNGQTANFSPPVQTVSRDGVTPLTGVAAISAGWNFTLALTADGHVLSWGDDSNSGVLGAGSAFNGVEIVPGYVLRSDGTALTGIVQVSAGYDFSLALASDGTVWAWGNNQWGQLGRTAIGGASGAAVQVQGLAGSLTLSRIAMVAAGGNHALALDLDGRVLAWGYAPDGSLGDGAAKPVVNQTSVPRVVVDEAGSISGFTDIASIAAGYADSYALGKDGRVLSWGSNFHSALGRGTVATTDNTPGRVTTAGGTLSLSTAAYPNLLLHAR
jgi:alpha-tubulin suppressor-like RCC1 family protein